MMNIYKMGLKMHVQLKQGVWRMQHFRRYRIFQLYKNDANYKNQCVNAFLYSFKFQGGEL